MAEINLIKNSFKFAGT